jgi:Flp pilus assembly protein TadB
MWGPSEVDLDRRIANQPGGLRRVRRSLLTASGVITAIAAVGAITSGLNIAFGIFVVLLAPLLIILAGVQVAIDLTRPQERPSHPESHEIPHAR